jgi:hypothetical protein
MGLHGLFMMDLTALRGDFEKLAITAGAENSRLL